MKNYFKGYFGMTLLGGVFDMINIIVVIQHYGIKGEEYEELMVLILTLIFLSTTAYWAGYVYLLKFKFPAYISD